jgi:hypothetical protein
MGYERTNERVEAVENPETGEKVFPWMAPDGRPVDDEGWILREIEK